ncbi:hypothetical protein B2G52_08740 [Neisseria lactamica]|uniref:Uncharacterized protein n=1 Tax=Neisseria lactamica TaxID=486 RepID=A0AAU8VVA2_NEILA|nr:hypothetical protein B2G52_08740 [Neisseria lactamica]
MGLGIQTDRITNRRLKKCRLKHVCLQTAFFQNIAVITCVNAALFGNSSISLLLLNYCSLCFCSLLPTTYFR